MPDFSPRLLSKINETPALLSLLYDANLLPEQVNSERDYTCLQAVVLAYSAGEQSNGEAMNIEIGTICPPRSDETLVLIRHIAPSGKAVSETHFTPEAARGLVTMIDEAANKAADH